jgi:hypothetical protein
MDPVVELAVLVAALGGAIALADGAEAQLEELRSRNVINGHAFKLPDDPRPAWVDSCGGRRSMSCPSSGTCFEVR